ncbi:MAG: aminoglycoside adenylyltransferase domain-containing protein [Planctomycetota bacterium]
MPNPTPYPELNGVLAELVRELQDALGDELIGVYLQGSFAVGDFDQDSDCDFIAITKSELTDRQIDALQATHTRIFDLGPEWAKHLEGSYFPRDLAASLDRRGEPVWYLDHGAQTLTRDSHCNTAVVRQVLHLMAIPLVGPPANTLVGPVPIDLMRAETFKAFADWADEIEANPQAWANRFYQGFIVLNYCRVWHDLVTGRAGTEWAKTQLDPQHHALIDRAWATRSDPYTSSRTPADPDDYAASLRLMRHITETCRAFLSNTQPTNPH